MPTESSGIIISQVTKQMRSLHAVHRKVCAICGEKATRPHS